jgi:hypothetical protein
MKFTNKALLVTSMVGFAASSFAELPPAATAALDAATATISDAEAVVWPVIGAMLVAGITIKLVKRFSSKI